MYAVIMAGGKGARFWPRSRNRLPKHLLDITGGGTLIQETVERVSPLVPPERILVVTAAAHAAEVTRQLPMIPGENILVEPQGRNTAPCIGLAAAFVARRAGDAVMIVLPSDHVVADGEEFRRVLRVAAAAAEKDDCLVTVGIRPTKPETGYGYIEEGPPWARIEGETVYHVSSIREKPSLEEARRLLGLGRFFWNSGMFVWKASVILGAIETFLPAIAAGLRQIVAAVGTPAQDEAVAAAYHSFPAISIDYGVMEKARNVRLVKGDFGWSDVGSWDALWEIAPKDERGNAAGRCAGFAAVDAAGNYVESPGKFVALVGVEDLVVVETPDALLICRRGRSQDVRKVVETLEAQGKDDLL